MPRLRDLRVARWQWKLAAVLLVWLVSMLLFALLPAETPSALRSALALIVNVASFLGCARVFRGRGEPIAPPRAWWRMTARARLSTGLGVAFSLLTGILIVAIFTGDVGVTGPGTSSNDPGTRAAAVIDVVHAGAIAFLYLNSAARLRALPPPPHPPVTPTFRTPRALRRAASR